MLPNTWTADTVNGGCGGEGAKENIIKHLCSRYTTYRMSAQPDF